MATSPMLKRGSTGEEVRLLQKGIAKFGKSPTTITRFDNSFGPGTELALKRFQADWGLPMTGVYDQPTYDLLAPQIDFTFVRLSDIDDYAEDMGVESAALKAVYTVESKGDGFLPSGKCIILYEGHVFYKLYAQKYGVNEAKRIAARFPTVVYPVWDKTKYSNSEGEHRRLQLARTIDAEIANSSASWGLFQVMGFNYALAGYDSVDDYVNAANESEHEQFYAGISFIKENTSMFMALKSRDWATFARRYNGSGYKANNYDVKLANAYLMHKRG